MSEFSKTPPEAVIEQEDAEPPEQLSPELLQVRDQIHSEYLVYSDQKEQRGEKNLTINKEFLEFIKDLNPAYTKFFSHLLEQNLQEARKNKKETKDWQEILKEYERKLEFLKDNYSLPLTDEEAVQALVFLKNENMEIAEKKIKVWRDFANLLECSKEEKIIYLSRAGFTVEETAPEIKDKHHKTKVKSGGLCVEDFKDLREFGSANTPTKNEVRFFIPQLVYTKLNFADQIDRIAQITKKLQQQCPEWNIRLTMGEANQISNQILAHYNETGKYGSLRLYARTLTRGASNSRFVLGRFDANGLGGGWGGWEADRDLGIFILGVEEISEQK